MENSLKIYFADLTVFFHNVINYHWNVSGGLFLSLHELTKSQTKILLQFIIELGLLFKNKNFYPPVNFEEIILLSSIRQSEAKEFGAREMIEAEISQINSLTDSSEAIISEFTDLSITHELREQHAYLTSQLYILRQFLKQ